MGLVIFGFACIDYKIDELGWMTVGVSIVTSGICGCLLYSTGFSSTMLNLSSLTCYLFLSPRAHAHEWMDLGLSNCRHDDTMALWHGRFCASHHRLHHHIYMADFWLAAVIRH